VRPPDAEKGGGKHTLCSRYFLYESVASAGSVMGFKRRRNQNNTTENNATNQSTSNTARNQQSTTAYQQPNQSTRGRRRYTIDNAEAHFNMQIPDQSTVRMLEQKQAKFGHKLHDWIAEGMPADILGKTRDMKAFRERQAERPPEVPRNIERQNRRSAIRSESATDDPSPAGETDVPESVRDVLSSRGQSLDPSIQRTMEDRMGDSFGDVRIHAGPAAAEACESINARAFTVGNHIAFNSGEYDPSSFEGQHVLAHELAHVRQQTEGAVSLLPQENVELEIDPDPEAEREAEETANRVVKGWKVDIRRMQYTDVHIQRTPDTSETETVDPLAELASLGLSETLLERIKQEIPAENHRAFVADVKRVLNSNKDPKDQGHIGEILSIEKGVDRNLAADLAETDVDNLGSIPASNTFTKGFNIVCGENNPEFDKIFYNKETMSVEAVIEEKTGRVEPNSAAKQASDHIDTITENGYDRVENKKWMDEDIVDNISSSDFEDVSIGVIVPSGVDDSAEHSAIEKNQVAEYEWSPTEFELLNSVLEVLK